MNRGIGRTARRIAVVLAGTALVVVGLPPLVDTLAPRSTTAPAPVAQGTDERATATTRSRPATEARADDTRAAATDGPPGSTSERSDRAAPSARSSRAPDGRADQPVRASDLPPLPQPVAFERGAAARLGRVVIPAIGVDAPFAEGVHDAVLTDGPGHWPGTPLPSQPGNAVLSGHRTTFTAPFGDLDLLAAGDEIRTSVGPRPSTTYRVTGIEVVPEAEYVDRVLRVPDDPSSSVLTLFACHPKGSRTHRIVVTAEA